MERPVLLAGGKAGDVVAPKAPQPPPKPIEPPNYVFKGTQQPPAPPAGDTDGKAPTRRA